MSEFEQSVATTDDIIGGRWVRMREIETSGGIATHEVVHVTTRRRGALALATATSSEAARRRLLRETEALARVQHPGVIDLHDAGAEDDAPFIVRELLEGRTLESLLFTRGKLSIGQVAVIGAQAAEALGAVHAAGVTHRDLHPGNVQIVRTTEGSDRVRLLGFDQACFDDDAADLNGPRDGVMDPDYASPEVVEAPDASSPRSDIYALGAVLFACLSGTVPRAGLSALDDMPVPMQRVLARALAPSPSQRFEDAHAFASALAAVVQEIEPARMASLPPSQRTSRRPTAPPPLVDEERLGKASRRREPRAPYATPISLSLVGRTVDGRSEDISEHGMLVVLQEEVVLGSQLVVRFALPIEGRVATCPAVVRWSRRAQSQGDAACALGLELVEPPAATCASIGRYVALMGGARG